MAASVYNDDMSMNIHKIRADANRLMQALITGGANSAEPMVNTWIYQKAVQASFENEELLTALKYAEEQGWIGKGPKEGWICLTIAGETAARSP
jgi:hypothetical protein